MGDTEMATANNDAGTPFDPSKLFREARDAQMDAWAKTMLDLVNSEAYADSTGAFLEAWLTGSGPSRKALQTSMTHLLSQLNLPSRDDVIRIAERLTNIEMRLDDLEAKLDEALPHRHQGDGI
jgi:hypothetical protein